MAQGSLVASSVAEDGYDEPDLVDEIIEEDIPLEEDEPLDPAAQHQADIEARARQQGWRPLSEYRGAPGKWVDAEDFLKRGESFLPFVQKDLRETRQTVQRLEQENSAMRAKMDEQAEVLLELRQFARNADAAGYNRALADLKAQQRNAVAEGNTEAFDAAQEKIDELEEGRAERPAVERKPAPAATAPQPQPQANAQLDPAVVEFIAQNPWFSTDRVLNTLMIAEHNAVTAEMPGLPLAENLERAKAAVMRRFPHKFGAEEQPEQRQPAPRTRIVAPSRPSEPARTRRDPFEQITDPAERDGVKRAYLRMKNHAPDLTAREYVALYLNPRADVLALHRDAKGGK